MARFGFATTDFTEYFDSAAAIMDPTKTAATSGQYTQLQRPGPMFDGGMVSVQSTGSGKSGIFLIAPKYQMSANGMYEAGWGINLGANFVLRQGYAQPFYRSRVASGDPVLGNKDVLLVTSVDEFRLDPVSSVDVRVEKAFKFNRSSFALDFDLFNAFNSATVLQRQLDARVTTYNNILEVMNPRIARLGVRFFF